MSDDPFLSRWSRLKREARQSTEQSPMPPPAAEAAPVPAPESPPPAPLPPVESLTPESDFAPFMKAEVDPGTRRQALKTLFQDPQFNVMDGLDTYIADYSQPDPLPAGWLEKMTQVSSLGDVFARREQEQKEAAEAEARRAAAVEQAEKLDPPVAGDVLSATETESPDSLLPVEVLPSRTGE